MNCNVTLEDFYDSVIHLALRKIRAAFYVYALVKTNSCLIGGNEQTHDFKEQMNEV